MEEKIMKKFVFLLVFIAVCNIAFADTYYIYEGERGHIKYIIEDNKIYAGNDTYKLNLLYKIENNKVYAGDDTYKLHVLYRIEKI
jgi:hypothetical protein